MTALDKIAAKPYPFEPEKYRYIAQHVAKLAIHQLHHGNYLLPIIQDFLEMVITERPVRLYIPDIPTTFQFDVITVDRPYGERKRAIISLLYLGILDNTNVGIILLEGEDKKSIVPKQIYSRYGESVLYAMMQLPMLKNKLEGGVATGCEIYLEDHPDLLRTLFSLRSKNYIERERMIQIISLRMYQDGVLDDIVQELTDIYDDLVSHEIIHATFKQQHPKKERNKEKFYEK